MGLKALDGFDHYNTITDCNARQGFLQYANLEGIFITGRDGGMALQTGFFTQATFGQRVASAGVGMAVTQTFATIDGQITFKFIDTVANVDQVTVVFVVSNHSIIVYRGTPPPFSGTVLYTSPNNVWSSAGWFFVEIWPVINSSTGSLRLRIDGNEIIALTGVNTQVSANAWWDQLWQRPSGMGSAIDDFYYCDSSTDPGIYANNDFLGDVRVATLSAAGPDLAQWSPHPGGNANWQNINEPAMDSDTTYNASTNAGDKDRFNFAALPNVVAAIFGVSVTTAARKDDAGARTFKNLVKSGGTEALGDLNSLPDTSYAYFSDLWLLNPDSGLNWTAADLNAIKAGYQLVA